MKNSIEYISCKHLAWIFPLCESRKIQIRQLLRGTRVEEMDLSDPEDFLHWNAFADVVSNMGKFLDEYDLRGIGRDTWSHGIFKLQASIGRVTFDAREQYLATWGHSGLCSRQFPLLSEVEFREPGRLSVRLQVKEGLQPCYPYLSILSGQMEGLTEALGLPRASVTMKPTSSGATYTVDYQERGWLVTAARRLWYWWRSYFVVTREFAVLLSEHEQLKQHNAQLQAGDRRVTSDTDLRLQNSALIAEFISDLIWVMNEQGEITYASPSCRKALGQESDRINFRSLLSPEDLTQLQEAVTGLIRENTSHISPIQITVPRERRTGIILRVQPFLSQLGEQKVAICIGTDISDQRRLEEELSQRVSSFKSITDSAPDAILTFDAEFRITYANPESSELFGYSLPDLQGMSIKDLIPETLGTNQLRDIYHHPERNKVISGMDVQGIRRDRNLVPLEVSVSSHELADGRYTTCIIRDVSFRRRIEKEREALEVQLQASQKMESIGQLSGGIAHDFNNLLIAILGYADLAMQAGNPEKLASYLAEIKKAGERGTEMTQKLLTFSRRQVIEPKLIEANELIEGVQEMITRLLPGNIEIEFNSTVKDTYLYAGPTQLEQVLINLAVNARDAMVSGGRISVQLSTGQDTQSDLLVIQVSDTGTGMDEEVLAHVFEPFYTTKPEGSGTGLGLAVVFGIVEQHHGFIKVESTLGVGTRFEIYLPTAQADETGEHRQQSTVPGGHETILIVEDNDQVRDLASLILAGAGYTVFEASDGEDGVRLYMEHAGQIDLVIMDVVMPKLGGRDAAERIREKYPDAPIVFTSGYSTDSPQTKFIEEQKLSVIPKPYGTDMLRAQVRAVLDSKHAKSLSPDSAKTATR